MNIIKTAIKDLLIIEPKIFRDERGWFMERFNQQAFAKAFMSHGLEVPYFVQDNHSCSHQGVVRGLHYQLGIHAQAKLVQVVQGRAWDVAVDIRQHSATFGQWIGIELSATNHKQFWIPQGFAHGFIALEDNTQCLYKVTNHYHQPSERSIIWNDPDLAINWPIESNLMIKLGDKDSFAHTLQQLQLVGDLF